MKHLGIDYGSKRVGIAVSNEEETVAFPRLVIPNDDLLVQNIKDVCDKEDIYTVIIGESKDQFGVDNSVMVKARIFADKLANEADVNVVWEPEFYTTIEAARLQDKNDMLDASSAAIILKSYLDKRRSS